MKKFLRYLVEARKHPTKFKNGQEFMDYVYSTWRHKDTYVEHQGGGAWFAEIAGSSVYKTATYDAKNKEAIWFGADDEEVE